MLCTLKSYKDNKRIKEKKKKSGESRGQLAEPSMQGFEKGPELFHIEIALTRPATL
jgi:hypothetical protein